MEQKQKSLCEKCVQFIDMIVLGVPAAAAVTVYFKQVSVQIC